MFQIILNPYGIAYALGLMPAGTAAPNPQPGTLDDYLVLSEEFGLAGAELFTPMLDSMDDAELEKLRNRLFGKSIVMSQPLWTGIARSVEAAGALGAKLIRMHLTPVLCGDRACCNWDETVRGVRKMLKDASQQAGEHGLSLAIENHQDFTSDELMELCETTGPN